MSAALAVGRLQRGRAHFRLLENSLEGQPVRCFSPFLPLHGLSVVAQTISGSVEFQRLPLPQDAAERN